MAGSRKAEMCSEHALDGMANVIGKKKCSHPTCSQRPFYGMAGSKKAEMCEGHALDGMVDVINKRCSHLKCRKVASLAWLASNRRRCARITRELGRSDINVTRPPTDVEAPEGAKTALLVVGPATMWEPVPLRPFARRLPLPSGEGQTSEAAAVPQSIAVMVEDGGSEPWNGGVKMELTVAWDEVPLCPPRATVNICWYAVGRSRAPPNWGPSLSETTPTVGKEVHFRRQMLRRRQRSSRSSTLAKFTLSGLGWSCLPSSRAGRQPDRSRPYTQGKDKEERMRQQHGSTEGNRLLGCRSHAAT